jgi:acyl-homoserine lactone synthase
MIHAILSANRHLYGDVVEQHVCLRHEIFVDEPKCEALRKPDGREIDVYDNENAIYMLALESRRVIGRYRLYPTTKPTMISEIFAHLAAVRGCLADALIWSRFFVAPDRRDGTVNLQPMASVQEFCLDQGIDRLCLVIETWWLPRFHDIGFVDTPLGLPAPVDGSWTMAATIDLCPERSDRARADRQGDGRAPGRSAPQTPSPVPTPAASPPRNGLRCRTMRDSQFLAKLKLKRNDQDLGYMSDMALELARVADEFRLGALQASTADAAG